MKNSFVGYFIIHNKVCCGSFSTLKIFLLSFCSLRTAIVVRNKRLIKSIFILFFRLTLVLNKLKEEETKREELESNLKHEAEKEEELQKQISEGQKKSGDEKEILEKELEEKSATVLALESEKDKVETSLKDREDENSKLKENILELEAKLKEL